MNPVRALHGMNSMHLAKLVREPQQIFMTARSVSPARNSQRSPTRTAPVPAHQSAMQMMQQAQQMMANMSPQQIADMQRMVQNMPPEQRAAMQNQAMAMGMGGGGMPGAAAPASATPSATSPAISTAMGLKNEGNELHKAGKHREAIAKYERAQRSLASQSGAESRALQDACMLNAAMCYLKLEDWHPCVSTCDKVLNGAHPHMRLLAHCLQPETLQCQHDVLAATLSRGVAKGLLHVYMASPESSLRHGSDIVAALCSWPQLESSLPTWPG
jgi:hypothetical protein